MILENSKNPEIWLDIHLCETIYEKFRDLQAKHTYGEPIPSFKTRYPGKLESLIESVKLKSDLLGYDVFVTGSAYYVNLARSQVFLNGNKRMAVIFSDIFFNLNGYEATNVSWLDLADLTLLVSEDKKNSSEQIIDLIVKIFKKIYLKKSS